MQQKIVGMAAMALGMAGLLAACGTKAPLPGPSTPSRGTVGQPSPSAAAGASPSTPPPPTSSSPPAPSPISGRVVSMDFISPTVGWVEISPTLDATSSTLYQTRDGGGHWQALTNWSASSWHFSQGGDGSGIVRSLSFLNSRLGWGLVPLGVGACQAGFGLIATSDGGGHWSSLGMFLGSDGPVSLAFDTPQQGWISNGSCAGAYTTLAKAAITNGAVKWMPGKQLFPAKPDTPVAPTATDLNLSVPGHGFLINAYWRFSPNVSTNPPLFQVFTLASAGGNWTKGSVSAGDLEGRIAGLSFSALKTGWAVVQNNSRWELESTEDQGQHWQLLHVGGAAPAGGFGPIDRVSQQVGYVVTQPKSNTAVLWKTVDGGTNWLPVAMP